MKQKHLWSLASGFAQLRQGIFQSGPNSGLCSTALSHPHIHFLHSVIPMLNSVFSQASQDVKIRPCILRTFKLHFKNCFQRLGPEYEQVWKKKKKTLIDGKKIVEIAPTPW